MRGLLVRARRLAGPILAEYGLKLVDVKRRIPKRSQLKKNGINICFYVQTNNPFLFGQDYENWRRIGLLKLAYDIGLSPAVISVPSDSQEKYDLLFDIYPVLKKPFSLAKPLFIRETANKEYIDVTKDKDVRFVDFKKLVSEGEIEEGSTFWDYCYRYGLDEVLMHGMHHISPDHVNVETLEALNSILVVNSFLDIGPGCGISEVAARKEGIRDVTAVDVSPVVCRHLRKNFPEYDIVEMDALDFAFDRHWDFVSIGIPYELLPSLLEKKGRDLARCCNLIVIQSSCLEFFMFEHDWICGKDGFKLWHWWDSSQTVGKYFRFFAEKNMDWQNCIVAGHDKKLVGVVSQAMDERGFKNLEELR